MVIPGLNILGIYFNWKKKYPVIGEFRSNIMIIICCFQNIMLEDRGNYECSAVNKFGKIEANGQLVVRRKYSMLQVVHGQVTYKLIDGKTAVTPLLTHWSYCSFVLGHQNMLYVGHVGLL